MPHNKSKFKTIFSAFSIVLVELALVAATTAAFVAVFNHMKIKSATSSASSIESSVGSSTQTVVQPNDSLPVSSAVQAVQQSTDWKLVLVNFDNKMPDNFQNVIVNKFNIDMDSRIVTPYQQMHDAAEKDKIHIWISSGFRNSAKQQQLFTSEIQSFSNTGLSYDDAVSAAAKSVARPGYSEHNTGLAIDINGVLDSFDGTPAFKWMQQHAQDYGFVLRYKKDKQNITKIKYEPWHYRYVGVENAKKMNELNMCLEEYVAYLKENSTASN